MQETGKIARFDQVEVLNGCPNNDTAFFAFPGIISVSWFCRLTQWSGCASLQDLMFNDYSDITDRIAEPPTWFDEHGVPRYGDFDPHKVANIYAIEVALVQVACQACRREFHVAFSFHVPRGLEGMVGNCSSLAEAIKKGLVWYGDPPNYNHCRDGVADSCYDLRVLQYWIRPAGYGKWVRDSSLEIDLPDVQALANYDKQFEVARIIALFPDIRNH